MPIKGLSERRRLPRLGKISLGIKKKTDQGKEYPSEVDYFVCPPEVQAVYGEKPKEIKIVFPVENSDVFFQQWYKCYGGPLLKCKGDGEKAYTWDAETAGLKEIPCPCEKLEKNECKQIGILQFLMPDIQRVSGIWQITTSSKNSIVDINSSIDFIRAICGRIRMIPLILKREETLTQRIGEDGKAKSGKHHTLKIELDAKVTLRQLQKYAQIKPEEFFLPPPDESRDDLLYPENGFRPEKEAEADALAEQKTALDCLLAELAELKYKLSDKMKERVGNLKTKENYEKCITFFENEKRKIYEQLEGGDTKSENKLFK